MTAPSQQAPGLHCTRCGLLWEEEEISGEVTHECPPGFLTPLASKQAPEERCTCREKVWPSTWIACPVHGEERAPEERGTPEVDAAEIECGKLGSPLAMYGYMNERAKDLEHRLMAEISLKWEARGQLAAAQAEINRAAMRLRAADAMAAVVDDWVRRNLIDARSALADARLDYGEPFASEEVKARDLERRLLAAEEKAARHEEERDRARHLRDEAYKRGEELEDAANIGRVFLAKLPPDYSWSECPTEYVTELRDQLAAAQAENERLGPLAEIGASWNADSSLEKWFPITAEHAEKQGEEIALMKAEDARLQGIAEHLVRDEPNITPGRALFRQAEEIATLRHRLARYEGEE